MRRGEESKTRLEINGLESFALRNRPSSGQSIENLFRSFLLILSWSATTWKHRNDDNNYYAFFLSLCLIFLGVSSHQIGRKERSET